MVFVIALTKLRDPNVIGLSWQSI